MAVKVSGYRLKSPKDLPETRKRLARSGRHIRTHADHLTLTSLIDVMAVVILFLIQSFSATGEIFIANPGIKLPQASYGRQLNRAPVITVQSDKVSLEGANVGDNEKIEAKIEERDWDLPLLSTKLLDYKRFFENIHPGARFPGEVIVQADGKLNFIYLKRVLFSLTKLGFTNINLAVRGEAKAAQSTTEPPPQEAEAGAR